MASASDHRAHAALQPADCLILLPQRLPAAVETSIGPAHYPAECTQSDAFLQPSLRARNGRANSNSLATCPVFGVQLSCTRSKTGRVPCLHICWAEQCEPDILLYRSPYKCFPLEKTGCNPSWVPGAMIKAGAREKLA